MKKNNVCKKCKKPLPEGYKYNECEHCRGEKAEMAKNVVKGVVGVVGTALSIMIAIKGKMGGKK